MFIKKDLRKIHEILDDVSDLRDTLKLAKRAAEFCGNISILCNDDAINSLANLKSLNLYDNSLTNLEGIDKLNTTPLDELNIGSNKLNRLPIKFGSLLNLRSLWLDDNEFEEFPSCICDLKNLEILRLSGNSLETIPSNISHLENLRVLALDFNHLREFPEGCENMPNLQELWLRQNRLTSIPEGISSMRALETLSVSSNNLKSLPESLHTLPRLRKIYANGNNIGFVSSSLRLVLQIEVLNLANNEIKYVPEDWASSWGALDPVTGLMDGHSVNCTDAVEQAKRVEVILTGNPIVIQPNVATGSEE